MRAERGCVCPTRSTYGTFSPGEAVCNNKSGIHDIACPISLVFCNVFIGPFEQTEGQLDLFKRGDRRIGPSLNRLLLVNFFSGVATGSRSARQTRRRRTPGKPSEVRARQVGPDAAQADGRGQEPQVQVPRRVLPGQQGHRRVRTPENRCTPPSAGTSRTPSTPRSPSRCFQTWTSRWRRWRSASTRIRSASRPTSVATTRSTPISRRRRSAPSAWREQSAPCRRQSRGGGVRQGQEGR